MTTQPRMGRTLSGDVYTQIRSDILVGRLHPGQKLRLAALCTRFGVSLTVVREALTRLAEQGLARSVPQIGFTVVPLDVDDLTDLTRARVAVETWALRSAIEVGGLDWETRVVATHYALTNTPPHDSIDATAVTEAWSAAHAAFHAALADGCCSPRMLGIRSALFDASEVYRRWSAPVGGRPRDLVAEHRAIMEASIARDADTAGTLLARHIETTSHHLIESQASS